MSSSNKQNASSTPASGQASNPSAPSSSTDNNTQNNSASASNTNTNQNNTDAPATNRRRRNRNRRRRRNAVSGPTSRDTENNGNADNNADDDVVLVRHPRVQDERGVWVNPTKADEGDEVESLSASDDDEFEMLEADNDQDLDADELCQLKLEELLDYSLEKASREK